MKTKNTYKKCLVLFVWCDLFTGRTTEETEMEQLTTQGEGNKCTALIYLYGTKKIDSFF